MDGERPTGKEEELVPRWRVELDRRQEKLEEQLRALGQSVETLSQTLPGLREAAAIAPAAVKGQEQVLARIEALDKVVAGVGAEVKEVGALKAELKSLCELYPELCKVVEAQKTAAAAPPPAPPAEPAKAAHPSGPAPGQVLGVEQAIELLKHWTGCPECVEKLRPRLQGEPGLLESLVKTYVPKPKEESGEQRGFVLGR